MRTRIFTPFLLLIVHHLSFVQSSIIPPPPPFNLSHFLYPKVTALTESSIAPEPPEFLQGVLEAISSKEKWALEDIRISELDVKKAKYSTVQRSEFKVRVGKAEVVLKMYEEVPQWKKLLALRKNGTSSFESLARKIGSNAVVDSFKIEGPFELRVIRGDDQLSLTLPSNASYSDLRRVSVGEGITVEVKGAEEISILHPSDSHQPLYDETGFIWPALCRAPLPVRILGSASVVAFRTQRPSALIQTSFSSYDTINLLPEKCYPVPNYKKPRNHLTSLSARIALLEKVLRSLSHPNPNASLGSLKETIRGLTIFRFRLETERDIRSNDTYWSTLAEWRTRPTVERAWFEIVARIEGELLKPLLVKKVKPLIDADSFAWSSLSSNLSFTKLPPVFVPPEALTLDVKW